ncbi:hypothetical protein RFI_33529, partial [Reticulomyxa filosa]
GGGSQYEEWYESVKMGDEIQYCVRSGKKAEAKIMSIGNNLVIKYCDEHNVMSDETVVNIDDKTIKYDGTMDRTEWYQQLKEADVISYLIVNEDTPEKEGKWVDAFVVSKQGVMTAIVDESQLNKQSRSRPNFSGHPMKAWLLPPKAIEQNIEEYENELNKAIQKQKQQERKAKKRSAPRRQPPKRIKKEQDEAAIKKEEGEIIKDEDE